MPIWIKGIWILIIIFCAFCLIWYLLGTTANFHRSLDLVERLILIFVWTPLLIFVLISIRLLVKEWSPSNKTSYIAFWFVLLYFISAAIPMFLDVNTRGWLYDDIERDPIKITSDGKYEYCIELINAGQKNRCERLYLRNLSTNETTYIPVDINTDEMKSRSIGSDNNWSWVFLKPTDVTGYYELSTTEYLRYSTNDNRKKKFLIDVESGTSQRIE